MRNCKSLKKDGLRPSILCPQNCPIQEKTKIVEQNCHKGAIPEVSIAKQRSKQIREKTNMPIDNDLESTK